MNSRGVAAKVPVLLGGAALTRSYVENDLSEVYEGHVDYARDAFEGLRLMDATMARARGDAARGRPRRGGQAGRAQGPARALAADRGQAAGRRGRGRPGRCRSAPTSPLDNPIPTPPFWGTRVVKGIALADYAGLLDERAMFLGQWGLRGARAGQGPVVRGAGGDRGPAAAAVLAGPAGHRGRAGARRRRLRLLPGGRRGRRPGRARRARGRTPRSASRFTFPRQRRDRHLCLADFWRPRELAVAHGEVDVLPLHLVTMGQPIADYANELFAKDAYRDYLEVHGLGVQLTEALAEYWHRRIREELTFPTGCVGRRGGPRGRRGVLQARLPRRALLARLRRLPGPGGPDQVRRAAAARTDRRGAVRGAAAAPRAVDGRARGPPPGGEVLQCRLSTPLPSCGTWTAR